MTAAPEGSAMDTTPALDAALDALPDTKALRAHNRHTEATAVEAARKLLEHAHRLSDEVETPDDSALWHIASIIRLVGP